MMSITRFPIFDDGGKMTSVGAINVDITERKQAEEKIRSINESLEQRVKERTLELTAEISERRETEKRLSESEEKTRMIVDSAVDGIVSIDDKGIILTFNAAAEKIFGYSICETAGENISMLMPTPEAKKHNGYINSYFETGDAGIIGIGREVIGKRKDGAEFPLDLSLSEFRHDGKITFVGIVRDVTERNAAEQELRNTLERLQQTQNELVQSEKMASLGELVAGVAHEINTPVGIGVTAASHLADTTTNVARDFQEGRMTKSQLEQYLESAKKATKLLSVNLTRAAELIRSFKQVAVDQSSDGQRQFNLATYLDEVILSLAPKLTHSKHNVTVNCSPDINIHSYPGAISQIVTNLILNSLIHAFGDDEEGRMEIDVEDGADQITLTYADNGKGMDEEELSKAFDPFFTTKRNTGGSGLGFAIERYYIHASGRAASIAECDPRRDFFRRLQPVIG